MIKLLLRTILFLFLLIGVFLTFNALVDSRVEKYYEKNFQEVFSPTYHPQILILGASKMAGGINTPLLSEKLSEACSFAFDGANPTYIQDLYFFYLSQYYQKPKLILCGLELESFSTFWRHIEQDSEYLPWRECFKLIYERPQSFKTVLYNRFPLIKERKIIFDVLRNRVSYYPYKMERYSRGFIPLEGELKNPGRVSFAQDLDHKEIEALSQCVVRWQEEGIAVVFVQTPVYLGTLDSASNTIFQKREKLMESFAKKYSVPFLNYNSGPDLRFNKDPKNFRDLAHLNEAGADQFTQLLIKDLKQLLAKEKWSLDWENRDH